MNNEPKSSIDQFSVVASRYVGSKIHAEGRTLKRVIELTEPKSDQTALDVATGAGHMALAMSPHVSAVFATDVTPQMLHQARKQAAERGITNMKFEVAAAESLPYPEGTFDIVTTRIAAHHFPDVQEFVKEAYRVLKPGGRLAVVDMTVPEDPESDRFLNDIEYRRDRSHVRSYIPSEWRKFFETANFEIEAFELTTDLPEGMSYREWMHRANASPELVEELKNALLSAPEKVKEGYGVREEGDDLIIVIPKVLIIGRKEC